ncbi:MAG: DUF3857 domain-containing protein [Candidatus Brachytrichaceae bacterium NZ_4S206]|jgi:tetratricopeptide (TPR) repeat protein
MSRAGWTMVVLALAVGCGAAQVGTTTPRGRPIDALRARAEASPGDVEVLRALAEAELLWDGGDPSAARVAVDRALALRPGDPVLWFLSATEHEQRGRMAEAFDAELRAIDAARTSDGPLDPAIAELLIGYAGGRETDVPDWRTRIEAALTRVVEEPGRVGMPARLAAAQSLARLLRRRGDAPGALQATARAGCVQRARVAGPFGPNPMLAFDRPITASGRGALAERYELGPTRGSAATRTLESRGCGFELGEDLDEELRGEGVWVLEAELEAGQAGTHVLQVRTPNAFRVLVDGEVVGGIDRRRAVASEEIYLPLTLTAGRHEVEVVLATRHPNPFVSLALSRSDASFAAERGGAEPEGESALAMLLRALTARRRGDPVGAREAARELGGSEPTATVRVTQADIALGDPHLPNEQRQDLARRLLAEAVRRDPEAWYPPYRVALAEQGARESLAALQAVAERFPSLASLQLELARRLAERGRTAEADALVERARRLVPSSCNTLSAELGATRRRGRIEEVDGRLGELLECDARSRARYALLVRQRRWEEAAREVERLAPLLEPPAVRELRLELALATGDEQAARRLRAEVLAEQGRSEEDHTPLRRIDELLADGQRDRAIAELGRAIERRPQRSGALRRVQRALGGEDPLYRYRLDGAEAIRRFEASGRRYDGAARVLVLDYMVVLLHEDGSSEELVHQIYRVQSEEAIEALGQISLPGYILTLRSIKPDGRRLEPDAIEGLDHIEMPSLAEGDYVEYEYVRARGPSPSGGFRSTGWVFQNFSEPFDRSELVLVAPEGLPVEVEARGPVPPPVERRDGRMRVLTWTVNESRPLQEEPRSAVSPERLPTLDFGVRAGWDVLFAGIIDRTLDEDVVDPAAVRRVREILGPLVDAPVEARARALHRWVLENIEDGNGGAPAAMQLAAGAGSRNRVLRYLLELAGIDARHVVVRTLGGRAPGGLMRDDVYPSSLVMVRRPDGPPIFTTAAFRGIPFGYVTPNLRGQQAVVLEPGQPSVVVDGAGSSELRDVRMDVQLAADGSARVSVEERFHGVGATMWRQQLEEVPAAELDRMFEEGYVVPLLGEGRLVSLRIEGREDPDAPLVLRYVADVPFLGRGIGNEQLVPNPFRSDLARGFASLPARETAQAVMGHHLRTRLTVRGALRSPSAPPAVELSGPGGARATSRGRVENEAIVVETEVEIPPMVVTPDQYAPFAELCRAVDRLEARELRISR